MRFRSIIDNLRSNRNERTLIKKRRRKIRMVIPRGQKEKVSSLYHIWKDNFFKWRFIFSALSNQSLSISVSINVKTTVSKFLDERFNVDRSWDHFRRQSPNWSIKHWNFMKVRTVFYRFIDQTDQTFNLSDQIWLPFLKKMFVLINVIFGVVFEVRLFNTTPPPGQFANAPRFLHCWSNDIRHFSNAPRTVLPHKSFRHFQSVTERNPARHWLASRAGRCLVSGKHCRRMFRQKRLPPTDARTDHAI